MAEAEVMKIDFSLDITEETAVLALKLVEMYLNGNTEKCLSITRRGDGTESYRFADRHNVERSAGNKCILCGDITNEGRHICPRCEHRREL